MPDVRVLASGHQDADFGVAGGDFGGDEFEGGSGDATVGAFDDVEWEPCESQIAPCTSEIFGFDGVEVEVHRSEVVGGECACVLDRSRGGNVELVDQDDDDMSAKDSCCC